MIQQWSFVDVYDSRGYYCCPLILIYLWLLLIRENVIPILLFFIHEIYQIVKKFLLARSFLSLYGFSILTLLWWNIIAQERNFCPLWIWTRWIDDDFCSMFSSETYLFCDLSIDIILLAYAWEKIDNCSVEDQLSCQLAVTEIRLFICVSCA